MTVVALAEKLVEAAMKDDYATLDKQAQALEILSRSVGTMDHNFGIYQKIIPEARASHREEGEFKLEVYQIASTANKRLNMAKKEAIQSLSIAEETTEDIAAENAPEQVQAAVRKQSLVKRLVNAVRGKKVQPTSKHTPTVASQARGQGQDGGIGA